MNSIKNNNNLRLILSVDDENKNSDSKYHDHFFEIGEESIEKIKKKKSSLSLIDEKLHSGFTGEIKEKDSHHRLKRIKRVLKLIIGGATL